MRRRAFIAALGSAAAWPVVARAQQPDRMRRIGVLTPLAADDPEGKARVAAFLNSLQQLGWTDGRNVRIDYRWSANNDADSRKFADELIGLTPDLILATGSTATGFLIQTKNQVPIVFVTVVDPVGAGFVDSLSRPGGNATGFTLFEYSTSGKWLEQLKEIAPTVTRAAILRDPTVAAGSGQLGAVQSAAQLLGVDLIPVALRDEDQIERSITEFARSPNSGLIVTAGGLQVVHRDLIIRTVARLKLPAIYFNRSFVTNGGLISYGPDIVDQYQRAASYADRILKGEKPADLPVQAPTKFLTVVNLKTAQALGLIVPPSLLARVDEVIE
jgi:putative ABC transport system substrate-binding protein